MKRHGSAWLRPLIVLALLMASLGASEAVAGKKKEIDLQLHYSGAYEDETSATGRTQSVIVTVDPVIRDHKVVIKYLEYDDPTDTWTMLDIARVKPSKEFGDAHVMFAGSTSEGMCMLKLKYAGNKKFKTAKSNWGINCLTGEVAAG